ncbi:MAG: hypothetical protein A3F68_11590 [Acidobacteria bacterium RIFCSPLOWO2_12_FULL_54_10]|nr:MAG: hypothetical protein A3F68_11590 [Acidobacteria bacterium RIFCSPLOWO2_12_FULL_54_10]
MAEQNLEDFKSELEPVLKELLQKARLNVNFRVERAQGQEFISGVPQIIVNFSGQDEDILLARNGEVLEAIEHLCGEILHMGAEERSQIAFDCHGYKESRLQELRLTAATAAEQVTRTGQPLELNAMNSRERRIIHVALQGNTAVRTESAGFGPARKIVVYPAMTK